MLTLGRVQVRPSRRPSLRVLQPLSPYSPNQSFYLLSSSRSSEPGRVEPTVPQGSDVPVSLSNR